MKITLDGAGKTLRLDFKSADALRSFAGDWLTKEGCLVRLAEPLKLWTELTVELRQAGAGETRPLAAFAPEPHDREGSPSNEPPDDPSDSVGGEMQGTSPVFRIRQMNVSQKMQLASKATVGERQILLRDGSPQVLMGLLANPRIEDKEVLALAKSSSASSGVLQRIAKDRRWSTNYEIRVALVKNPQTPTPLAVRMLDTLRERELRVMAKGSAVREVIRAAALRKVIKLG
jgi:hypothetical protein